MMGDIAIWSNILHCEVYRTEEAVRAFFESLEMGAADAWTLFASLDADGDNVISPLE